MLLVEAFPQTSILQEMWISLHQYKGLVDQQVCWLHMKNLLQVVPMDNKFADVTNINIIVHFPCFQLVNGCTILCLHYVLTTYCVTFVMLLVVNIKTTFLYDVMPCSLANRYMISHLTGSNLNSTFLFSVIFVMF